MLVQDAWRTSAACAWYHTLQRQSLVSVCVSVVCPGRSLTHRVIAVVGAWGTSGDVLRSTHSRARPLCCLRAFVSNVDGWRRRCLRAYTLVGFSCRSKLNATPKRLVTLSSTPGVYTVSSCRRRSNDCGTFPPGWVPLWHYPSHLLFSYNNKCACVFNIFWV